MNSFISNSYNKHNLNDRHFLTRAPYNTIEPQEQTFGVTDYISQKSILRRSTRYHYIISIFSIYRRINNAQWFLSIFVRFRRVD